MKKPSSNRKKDYTHHIQPAVHPSVPVRIPDQGRTFIKIVRKLSAGAVPNKDTTRQEL
ncbi:hypothetical protein MGI18_18980 [Bacillus sp. OVS6]|nr:hypothetical protein MGI18_18980 [Bacillus sp. OVS6]